MNDQELDRILEEYREAQKNRVRTPEELFEMSAAFGPGAEVVDIITGERFTLPN